MRLELNEVEERVLVEILEESLNRLGDEISHTDSFEYREFLKERKELLLRLRGTLH